MNPPPDGGLGDIGEWLNACGEYVGEYAYGATGSWLYALEGGDGGSCGQDVYWYWLPYAAGGAMSPPDSG